MVQVHYVILKHLNSKICSRVAKYCYFLLDEILVYHRVTLRILSAGSKNSQGLFNGLGGGKVASW